MRGWCNAAAALLSVVPLTTALEEPSGGTDYDVSAIAANGFPNEDDKYSELLGTHFSGGLVDLTSSDDKFLDVDSAFLPGQGYYASIRADFVITEQASTVTELGITVEAHLSPGRYATGTLFAYNWTLDKYEYVKAFSVRASGNKPKLAKIEKNTGEYVSSCGKVRIVVRAHGRAHRKVEQFHLRIDLVRLNVRAS